MKPRITIEDQFTPRAIPIHQHSWLWKITLPCGKWKWLGSVRLFTIEEVLSSPKLRRWVKANA